MLPIGVGAYSVASLPDAGVFFVGGIDVYAYPIATVDPEAWDELGYELNETVGRYGLSFAQTKGYLSEPIALPDYTRAGDSSVSRVAVSMQATSNRLYVVVGDIDDEPATDTLDILVFAHQDGVIDRDVLGFFELDESLGRSLLTRIAVQPNGLATIRSLPTERNAYGAPPFATYDLLDPSAPILVATGQFENEDRFGIGGVAGLRDHILMPALDGLRMRTSSAEGGRLR